MLKPKWPDTALQTNTPGCHGLCFAEPQFSATWDRFLRPAGGHSPRQPGVSLSLRSLMWRFYTHFMNRAFLVLSCAAFLCGASAEEAKTPEKLLSTSPDRRFQLFAVGEFLSPDSPHYNGLEFRDTISHATVPVGDDISISEAYWLTSTTAIWHPGSRMVALSNTGMNKHGGEAHVVLELHDTKLTVFELAEDAQPVRWAADGSLICTVRTEAPFYLNREKKAFTRNRPSKPKTK